MVEQQRARAVFFCKGKIVYNAYNRPVAMLQPFFYQCEYLPLIYQIKVVRGLIKQQILRVLREHLRKERPLQLPAGKREHGLPALRRHARFFKSKFNHALVVIAAPCKHPRRIGISAKAHDFFHAERIPNVMVLREHAYVLCQFNRLLFAYVLPVQKYLSRVCNAACNGVYYGGLSRAVGAGYH